MRLAVLALVCGVVLIGSGCKKPAAKTQPNGPALQGHTAGPPVTPVVGTKDRSVPR